MPSQRLFTGWPPAIRMLPVGTTGTLLIKDHQPARHRVSLLEPFQSERQADRLVGATLPLRQGPAVSRARRRTLGEPVEMLRARDTLASYPANEGRPVAQEHDLPLEEYHRAGLEITNGNPEIYKALYSPPR